MHVNVDGATERLSDIVPGVLLTDASLAGGPGENGQSGEHRRRPYDYPALTCSDAHCRLLRCKHRHNRHYRRDWSASGSCMVTLSSFPTTLVMWPFPVRSSASSMCPGPREIFLPPATSISPRPLSVITYWRRGAVCQSLTLPPGARSISAPG